MPDHMVTSGQLAKMMPRAHPMREGLADIKPREKALAYIEERIHPEPNSGCWLWIGPVNQHGYGRFSVGPGDRVRAHRVSYELHRGPIPPGAWVLHRCDTPACVNPAHLKLGTPRDNSRDRQASGRQADGSKHGRAKLSEDDVREIRALCASGVGQRAIAERFGVERSLISMIQSRKLWRRV